MGDAYKRLVNEIILRPIKSLTEVEVARSSDPRDDPLVEDWIDEWAGMNL